MSEIQKPLTIPDATEKIERRKSKIKNIWKAQKVIWKQEIPALAQEIEDRYILLDQQWLISNISQEITKFLRDENIHVWPFAYMYLDSKYKDENKVREDFTSHLDNSLYKRIEDLSYLKQNVQFVPRDSVADIVQLARQTFKEFERRAAEENIPILPDANDNNLSSNQSQRDPVKIDKPKPHGTLTYEAMILAGETIKEAAKRVFEFPVEILDHDKEMAEAWLIFVKIFAPALDLKYSKSKLDWLNAERYRDIFGKHAAAVLSFSVSNLCANCSDENTKTWVRMEPVRNEEYETYQCLQCGYKIDAVCPSCNITMRKAEKTIVGWKCSDCDGTTPIKRDLTREQIGDKSSIVMEEAIEMVEGIPIFVWFCRWYRDWIDPLVAGRKVRLHSDLSDMA